jgi:hypothetical protein
VWTDNVKPVPGFEGLWADETGSFFEGSADRPSPLKISLTSEYPRVSILVDGRRTRFHVHILMAVTFLGLDLSQGGRGAADLQVDHKDGNKQNNRLDNLEVVTRLENTRRAWKNGLYKRNGYASKDRPKLKARRFTEEDVQSMADMRSQGLSYREIGRRMDCDHKAVYRILRGDVYKSWS